MKDILYATGFQDVWIQQATDLNHAHFISNLTVKLQNIYKEQWKLDMHDDTKINLNQRNKLRTYRLFKTDYSFENYLKGVKDSNTRKAITRLRISAHSLQIEKGRHLGRPVAERKCVYCTSGEIEDEYHIIMKCAAYDNTRKREFDKLKISIPFLCTISEKDQFVEIMKIDNISKITALSNLLENINTVRGCL